MKSCCRAFGCVWATCFSNQFKETPSLLPSFKETVMSDKKIFFVATLLAGLSFSLMSYLTYHYIIPRIVFPYSLTAYLLPITLCLKLGVDPGFLRYFSPLTYITMAFWLCNPKAFFGKTTIPKHSFLVCAVFLLFSIWYYLKAWPYGMQYQGAAYTIYVVAMNLAIVAALGVLGYCAWKNPSFKLNLFFHWSLFAWFQTFAFAYLGELL